MKFSIRINQELDWNIVVGRQVLPSKCTTMVSIPDKLKSALEVKNTTVLLESALEMKTKSTSLSRQRGKECSKIALVRVKQNM